MKRKLLAIIAVLLVVSMACSFLKPKSTPTPEMDQTGSMDNGDQEDDDESPPGDDGDDGGDETTDDEGDQGFSLDSNAFDQLDYYRSNIVMRYEAGDGTLDESIIDTAYIRDPSAQHLIMETNGEGLEMIQIGDADIN